MKDLNKNAGFTLIELLAVIVVLAIITVIATQAILPLIANTERDAFAAEANIALDGASDMMTLVTLGSITAIDGKYSSITNGYCFTLQNLKDAGFFDKDLDGYSGHITAIYDSDTSVYNYSIKMKNDRYYVNEQNVGDITVADDETQSHVKELNETEKSANYNTCS